MCWMDNDYESGNNDDDMDFDGASLDIFSSFLLELETGVKGLGFLT